MIDAIALRAKLAVTTPAPPRARGQSDFNWLKKQALDQATLETIELIEQDELNFIENGIIVTKKKNLTLNLKQGTIHTTRLTGHSVANLFVQIYKLHEHMVLKEFVEGAKVILDIGANEGYYALNMLSHNPDAQVICIEPNPIALDLLKKNIKANGVRNRVTIVGQALWSTSGNKMLSVIPQATSISAINVLNTSFAFLCPERVKMIKVPTTTPVELFKKLGIGKVDILKMDIEGGEAEVLKALLPLLPQISKLVLEYHSKQLKKQITDLMARHGYEVKLHIADRDNFGDLYFERSDHSESSID